jgi:hypothetical protein
VALRTMPGAYEPGMLDAAARKLTATAAD